MRGKTLYILFKRIVHVSHHKVCSTHSPTMVLYCTSYTVPINFKQKEAHLSGLMLCNIDSRPCQSFPVTTTVPGELVAQATEAAQHLCFSLSPGPHYVGS